jgi:hypothetical protein
MVYRRLGAAGSCLAIGLALGGCARDEGGAEAGQATVATAGGTPQLNPASQQVHVGTRPWIPRGVSAPFLRIPGVGSLTARCADDDHVTVNLRLARRAPTTTIVLRTDDLAPRSLRLEPGEDATGDNPGDPPLLETWLVTPISKGAQRVTEIQVAGDRSYTGNGCALSVKVESARETRGR